MSRMAQQTRITRLRFAAALLLCCGFAWAGDEEMMNPYQIFDPETGFFVDDPEREQETSAKDEVSRTEHASEPAPASSSGDDRLGNDGVTRWIGGALLLAFVGYLIFRGFSTRSQPK